MRRIKGDTQLPALFRAPRPQQDQRLAAR
jgi:hypothetical protein